MKKWKKVEVNLKEHVYVPILPDGMSKEYYDDCLSNYLTKLSMEPLSQNRPLWEVHIFKYPTNNAAGNSGGPMNFPEWVPCIKYQF